MRIKSFAPVAILALMFIFNINSFAEGRSIYIGDQIVLEINDATISEEDIREAFEDFRLVEIEDRSDGYKITLSPESVGSHEINLNNQKIIIDVKSTLDEIQRDTIFEKELNTGRSFDRRIIYVLLSVSSVVLLASHGIWFIKMFKKDAERQYTPYEIFIKMFDDKHKLDKHLLGELTKASKSYLSQKTGTLLIGLTTSQLEQVEEMKEIDEIKIRPYFDWLKECDDMKYKGDGLLEQEIVEMKQRLQTIIDDLEDYFLQEDRRVMDNAV